LTSPGALPGHFARGDLRLINTLSMIATIALFIVSFVPHARCTLPTSTGYDCRLVRFPFPNLNIDSFGPLPGAFMKYSQKMLALTVVLSVILAACGEKKTAGHAAVKINGETISVAELERQMEESGQSPASGITGQMMKSMIDKELLRQAAIKDKVDTDERVRASLALANRMILASAYMHKQIQGIGKPTEAEVSGYFNQHPEFFAERKLYDVQEVAIKGKPANAAEIKAKVAGGTNLKDFLRWLDEKKIPYTNQQFSVASDQMRDVVAKKLGDARIGQAVTLDDPNQIAALFINAAQVQPVTLAQASPMIMKRIFNTKMSEGMENKIKQLREQAKIEYVAPFTENGKVSAEQ
jgi:EpsD family peptidyl-prolyl cis-trans isomerase